MSKDEFDTRHFKGRQHDKVRDFANRTSAMREPKNGTSDEGKEVVSRKMGVAAQGN